MATGSLTMIADYEDAYSDADDNIDPEQQIQGNHLRGNFTISQDGKCPRCNTSEVLFVILDELFPMGDMPEILHTLIAKGKAVLWSSQEKKGCKAPPSFLCRGFCPSDSLGAGFNVDWSKVSLESIFLSNTPYQYMYTESAEQFDSYNASTTDDEAAQGPWLVIDETLPSQGSSFPTQSSPEAASNEESEPDNSDDDDDDDGIDEEELIRQMLAKEDAKTNVDQQALTEPSTKNTSSSSTDQYPVSRDGSCPHCRSTKVKYIIMCKQGMRDVDLPFTLRELLRTQLAFKMAQGSSEPPSFQCQSCQYGFNLDWSLTNLEAIFDIPKDGDQSANKQSEISSTTTKHYYYTSTTTVATTGVTPSYPSTTMAATTGVTPSHTAQSAMMAISGPPRFPSTGLVPPRLPSPRMFPPRVPPPVFPPSYPPPRIPRPGMGSPPTALPPRMPPGAAPPMSVPPPRIGIPPPRVPPPGFPPRTPPVRLPPPRIGLLGGPPPRVPPPGVQPRIPPPRVPYPPTVPTASPTEGAAAATSLQPTTPPRIPPPVVPRIPPPGVPRIPPPGAPRIPPPGVPRIPPPGVPRIPPPGVPRIPPPGVPRIPPPGVPRIPPPVVPRIPPPGVPRIPPPVRMNPQVPPPALPPATGISSPRYPGSETKQYPPPGYPASTAASQAYHPTHGVHPPYSTAAYGAYPRPRYPPPGVPPRYPGVPPGYPPSYQYPYGASSAWHPATSAAYDGYHGYGSYTTPGYTPTAPSIPPPPFAYGGHSYPHQARPPAPATFPPPVAPHGNRFFPPPPAPGAMQWPASYPSTTTQTYTTPGYTIHSRSAYTYRADSAKTKSPTETEPAPSSVSTDSESTSKAITEYPDAKDTEVTEHQVEQAKENADRFEEILSRIDQARGEVYNEEDHVKKYLQRLQWQSEESGHEPNSLSEEQHDVEDYDEGPPGVDVSPNPQDDVIAGADETSVEATPLAEISEVTPEVIGSPTVPMDTNTEGSQVTLPSEAITDVNKDSAVPQNVATQDDAVPAVPSDDESGDETFVTPVQSLTELNPASSPHSQSTGTEVDVPPTKRNARKTARGSTRGRRGARRAGVTRGKAKNTIDVPGTSEEEEDVLSTNVDASQPRVSAPRGRRGGTRQASLEGESAQESEHAHLSDSETKAMEIPVGQSGRKKGGRGRRGKSPATKIDEPASSDVEKNALEMEAETVASPTEAPVNTRKGRGRRGKSPATKINEPSSSDVEKDALEMEAETVVSPTEASVSTRKGRGRKGKSPATKIDEPASSDVEKDALEMEAETVLSPTEASVSTRKGRGRKGKSLATKIDEPASSDVEKDALEMEAETAVSPTEASVSTRKGRGRKGKSPATKIDEPASSDVEKDALEMEAETVLSPTEASVSTRKGRGRKGKSPATKIDEPASSDVEKDALEMEAENVSSPTEASVSTRKGRGRKGKSPATKIDEPASSDVEKNTLEMEAETAVGPTEASVSTRGRRGKSPAKEAEQSSQPATAEVSDAHYEAEPVVAPTRGAKGVGRGRRGKAASGAETNDVHEASITPAGTESRNKGKGGRGQSAATKAEAISEPPIAVVEPDTEHDNEGGHDNEGVLSPTVKTSGKRGARGRKRKVSEQQTGDNNELGMSEAEPATAVKMEDDVPVSPRERTRRKGAENVTSQAAKVPSITYHVPILDSDSSLGTDLKKTAKGPTRNTRRSRGSLFVNAPSQSQTSKKTQPSPQNEQDENPDVEDESQEEGSRVVDEGDSTAHGSEAGNTPRTLRKGKDKVISWLQESSSYVTVTETSALSSPGGQSSTLTDSNDAIDTEENNEVERTEDSSPPVTRVKRVVRARKRKLVMTLNESTESSDMDTVSPVAQKRSTRSRNTPIEEPGSITDTSGMEMAEADAEESDDSDVIVEKANVSPRRATRGSAGKQPSEPPQKKARVQRKGRK